MRAIDADKLIDDLYELKYTKESPSIILTPAGQEIYNSGVDSAIGTILEAPTIGGIVPKWISVKEKLPSHGQNILTNNGHGVVRIMALWKKDDDRWKWIENKRFKYYNDITHWMPLPEPPKDTKGD